MTIIHREAFFAMRRVESDCERIRQIGERQKAVFREEAELACRRVDGAVELHYRETIRRLRATTEDDDISWRCPSDTEVPFSA